MTDKPMNYAFIDSQNVYLGIKERGWKLDFHKFRRFLKEKYKVEKAIIVSGDGDFYCLAEHLKNNSKLEGMMVPDKRRYSALLKKLGKDNSERKNYLIFLEDAKEKIKYAP